MNKAKVRKKSINYVNRFFNTVINVMSQAIYCLILPIFHTTFRRH